MRGPQSDQRRWEASPPYIYESPIPLASAGLRLDKQRDISSKDEPFLKGC